MSIINGDTAFAVDYQDNGNIDSKSDLGDYYYNGSHPHAVESVDCYDSIQYAIQDVSYTSFNIANQVTQGDSTLVFTYGPDYARKKTVTTIAGTVITRYYSWNYEKIVASSSTKELHYITAYGRMVAIAQKSGGTTTMYYVHTDHLGSVNCITNSNDSIVQETSFMACSVKHGFCEARAKTDVELIPPLPHESSRVVRSKASSIQLIVSCYIL